MRSRSTLRLVLGTAAIALGISMVGAGSASAGPSFTDFGSGTGIHTVTYQYQGGAALTSEISRSGSGIVQQWVAPSSGDVRGAYYLFKPLSSSTVTTPFKRSCSQTGLVAGYFPRDWTYTSGNYTPSGVLAPYFPFDGLVYYVCEYELSSYATGSVTYTVGAGSTFVRHVTFDVQAAAPGFAGGGTMTYTDADSPANDYTIAVTLVHITSTTATFSGPYPAGSTTQWLILQAYKDGSTLGWGGDVVATEPTHATLAAFTPGTVGLGVTGTITIYTR